MVTWKAFLLSRIRGSTNDTDLWDKPKSLSSLVHQLSFIENKEHWGTYFQGGIRGISEQDFRAILEGSTSEGRKAFGGADIESEAEFALETHLEQFIDENWNNIDFGAKLERYKTKGKTADSFLPAHGASTCARTLIPEISWSLS